MVAVFTGNALGLFDTSLTQLGTSLGSDSGRNRQGVNAANGNLVLQGLDEILNFRGLSISATRTYNSQGTFAKVGSDGWLTGFERRVELSGTLNQSGSVVTLFASDGSEIEFEYTGTPNRYQSTAGDGAHDTMIWSENPTGFDYWMFDEGSSRRREYFRATTDNDATQARLHQIRDVKSDGVTPTYFLVDYTPEGRVSGVRAADGSGNAADAILFTYDGSGRLVATSTRENGTLRDQVRYGYDGVGRLAWVEHDLTPLDREGDTGWNGTTASANDGSLYRTTYTYVDATSIRIASVLGSDGTLSSYTYDGDGRVKTVTRGDTNIIDADGLGETLTFTYETGRTHVVDSLGRMWTYVYDGEGQLTEQYGPARDGLRDVTYFQYDPDGNVSHSRTLRGGTLLSQTDRTFDTNGSLVWEWDALGNATHRTYTSANQVASLTVYTGIDPDGIADGQAPTGGATSRFFYDAQYKLRFSVGPAGEVSEIRYATSGNGVGQQESVRTYLGAAYSGTYSLTALADWAAGQLGNSTLSEFSYDARGRLERRLDFASVDSGTGAGVVDSALAVTRFVHDAQGLLRTQRTVRAGDRLAANAGMTASDTVVDYVYDGIGRLLDVVQRGGDIAFSNWVNPDGSLSAGPADAAALGDSTTLVTRTEYLDSAMRISVTQDSGATRLETRNAAGRLISAVESASGQASRTTQNFYDSTGQLRAVQDASGGRTYYFYDERGNVAAEVDATGAVVETVRDALGRVVQTLVHAERVDTSGWIVSGKVVRNSVAEIRPGWTVDFASTTIPELDTSLLNATYAGGIRIEGGKLVVQRADHPTSAWPYVRSSAVHTLADGAYYSAEVSTTATISPSYFLYSLHNNLTGSASRRVGAYISNGNLYKNLSVGGTNTNTLIGSLAPNTTYHFEVHANEGGIEYRVYAKGQDRDNGFSFREDIVAAEWPQVRFQINTSMGPGLSGPEIHVDNLRHSLVRRTDRDYDSAGRLIRETDGTAVTTHTYDGASRLVRSVRSAPGEADRVTRYFHDAAGRVVGTLDAEGYLTENAYDLAGRLVKTTRYANRTSSTYWASGTLAQLRPVANAGDQTERLFYDGRGQLAGRLDAEGYLTQTVFDEVGNDRATLSYGLRLTGLGGTESLATLIDAADAGAVRQTLRVYNALGQLYQEQNHEGTITRFHYDADGRLVRTEQAQGITEVRHGTHWYDAFGQLIGELGGQGSVDAVGALRVTDGMTDAQKLAVFTAYGVRHSYDVLGRRIESIDAEGNRTWYFYDARGRQTYTVKGIANGATRNALGEVTETRYNAFGQISETLAYTGRIAIVSPYGRAQVQTAITALSFVAAVDSRQQYSYDSRGLLISQISAEGSVSHMRYTGHGQLRERTDFVGSGAEVTSRYQYDLRGLQIGQTDAVGAIGVERSSSQVYDAFGRVTSSTDARGNAVTYAYDRLGRLIDQRQAVQGRTGIELSSYDAWGRVLTRTNAIGQVTTYAYDDISRSVVVSTPQGLDTTTVRNRFGETASVTDDTGALTSLQYDRDGQLTRTTDAVGDIQSREYNVRGLLSATVDGNGTRTHYTYDAAGRLLSRIDDAGTGKLNRTTTYAYDGQGRSVTETDANGKVTATTYDREGRVLTVARDPSGLNLRTQYSWDAAGRQLSVTEGFGTPQARTVAYAYDALGRRLSETVDPGAGKLNLITRYAYDANGNVVARTNAEGHVTRFVYDQANQLVFTVDPEGAISRQWYDEAGRVVAIRRYANKVALDAADIAAIGSANGADALARLTTRANAVASDASDRVEYQLRDQDGRLRYRIDSLGIVNEIRYDAAGRAVHQLAYASPIVLDASLKTRLLQQGSQTATGHATLLTDIGAMLTALEANAQARYSVLDAAGRERFTVVRANATQGYVTEQVFDDEGRVVARIAHLLTVTYSPTATLSATASQLSGASAAQKVETRYVYDALGRLRFTVDDIGAVTEQRYDALGQATQTRQYMGLVTGVPFTESALAAAVAGQTGFRSTQQVYDAAGRLRFSVDSLGAVTERRYDAVGQVVEAREYLAPVSGVAMSELALDSALPDVTGFRKTVHLYDASGRLVRTTDALGNHEEYGYDAVGNRTSYTDKLGRTWTYGYDAAGRLVEERTPPVNVYRYSAAGGFAMATASLPIVTRMTYDAWGNVLSRTENAEAVSLAERRTTNYEYDLRGNQVRTIFPDAGRIDEASATGDLVATGVRPEIQVTYNALGQAVAQRDVLGNHTYKVYDAAGRLSHDIDAAGYVTAYTYDATGQQTALVRYANRINTAPIAGWTPGTAPSHAQMALAGVITADAANDRTLTTFYDARGLKAEVRQSSIAYWTSAGVYNAGAQPRTTFSYDSLGQLVKESVLLEGSTWAHTHHYYDLVGRRVMSVDAEGYVTAMEYDAIGQETLRIEFARPVPTAGLSTATPPALPAPGNLDTGYDRVVSSEYDALGRKTGETVQRLFQNVDGSSGVRDVLTSYEYDAEGRQTAVVADGARTTTTYDALGRVLNIKEPERLVLKDNRNGQTTWSGLLGTAANDLTDASLYESITPYTQMYYDAFGNAVRVIRWNNGLLNGTGAVVASSDDQWTYTRYDWQGRAVATQDAAGNVVYSAYDAADRVVHTWHKLTDGQGVVGTVHGHYTYDAVGRQTTSVMSRVIGTSPAVTDAQESARYNAFGEVIRKGTTEASLDAPGGYSTHNYDQAGNAIYSNQAGGNRWYRYNLAGQQMREERDWIDPNGATVRVLTSQKLDRLGRTVGIITPSHNNNVADTGTTTRRLDRWGNVLEEVDPRGNVTSWTYNDRNQAIRQFAPRVMVLGTNGVETWQRPETRWMYDAAGRLIGLRDANGHTDRYEYDAAGRLLRSVDALGHATLYGYDGLGRKRVEQDALGYLTTQAYDRMNRVVATGDYLTSNDGLSRTAHTRESYVLNQRGDRIQVANQLGQTQRYDYDSRGLVLRSQSAAGVVMRYSYDAWGNKAREDNGLNAYQTWTTDVHGRQTGHRDLGGHVYTYGYDAGGQRITEYATVGGVVLNRKIFYYPNGQIRRIELSATDYTEYQYDAAGNRTYERTVNTARSVDMVTRAVYDSHNRLVRVTTDDLFPATDLRILDLEYAYDAVGNRRRVIARSGYGPGVDPIGMTNAAPELHAAIPAVTLKQGQANTWRWSPGDYFSDPEGTELGYTVTLDPSGTLPAWLSYSQDPATGEWVFNYTGGGTLGQTVTLRVTASDGAATAHGTFTARVVSNSAPVVIAGPPLELRHKTGDALSTSFQAQDLFSDSDVGDVLNLTLVGAVPAWLGVQSIGSVLQLSANAGAVPAGTHSLTLRATDASGAFVDRTLTLRAAAAAGPSGIAVTQQVARANSAFLFERPLAELFTDPNGDSFAVTAMLSSGASLPAWLSYAVVTVDGVQKLRLYGDVPFNATHNQVYTVRLTAVDSDGMSGLLDFGIRLDNPPPNVAPVYNSGILTDKTIGARALWTYTVPAGTFTDANGDTLTYTAHMLTYVPAGPPAGPGEPGEPAHWVQEPLPSWLVFNAATRTFQGTPPSQMTIELQVTARDPSGGAAAASFTLGVTESAPIYHGGLPARSAKEGDTVSYPLPAGTFSDANGDTLTYSAQVQVGTSWLALSTLGLSINSSSGAISGTVNSAPQGSYTVRITASDGSANVSGTFALTVNRRPTAPANTSVSVVLGEAFTKTVPGFSDPDGGTLTYSATTSTGAALPSWLSVNPSNGTLSGTPPTGFTGLAVLVRATDPAGLWASTTVSINVVNPPPQYVAGRVPGSFSVVGGNAWSYQVPSNAFTNQPTAEAVTLSARLSSGAALPAWLSFNAGTRTFSGTVPVGSSTTVVLLATDAAGGVASTSFTITGSSNPPVYNGGLVDRTLNHGQTASWTLPGGSFTDVNHQTLTYTAEVYRPGYYYLHPNQAEPTYYEGYWTSLNQVGLSINASTGAISGTPGAITLGNGTERWGYQIRVNASDGSAAASGTFNVSVVRPPVPPAGTTMSVYANQAFTRQVVFTDPDGQTLTYTASGLPAGVTMNSAGVLSSSTGKAVGSYSFSVTATDPGGASATATFTLTAVNQAPIVANTVGTQAAMRDQAWSLNVANTFSDPNNDPLTWSASGLPAGLSFNASTKVISGTPTAAGTYTVTLAASDGLGGNVSTSFTLTVNAPAANIPPIVSNPIPDQWEWYARNWYFTVPANTFSDANGHALSYSVSGMPAGMSFDAATRTFYFYTPSITSGASYNLTVTANDGNGGTVSDSFWLHVEPYEVGGGGPGGGGPGGGMQNFSAGSDLRSARNSSARLAASTDTLMAASVAEPEMVQTQSTSSVGSGLNRQENWYTYDAENRVQIVNGKLENGQILLNQPSIHQSSYLVQYDAAGREVAQIYNIVSGQTVHRINYTQRGERAYAYSESDAAVMAPSTINTYDSVGRLTRTTTYFHPDMTLPVWDPEGFMTTVSVGGLLQEVVDFVYDADGRLVSQTTRGRKANANPVPINTPNPERYEAPEWVRQIAPHGYVQDEVAQATDPSVLTLLDEVLYTTEAGTVGVRTDDASAYDAAGRLGSYRYAKHATAWKASSGYNAQEQQTFTHTYAFTYLARDGYLEDLVNGESSNTSFKASKTDSVYDAAGRRIQILDTTPLKDQDPLESRRDFAYNADGQILTRSDWYKDDGVWKQGKDEGTPKLQNVAPTVISGPDWFALTKAEREAWYDKRDNQRLTYVAGQLVASQDEAGKLDVTGQLTGFSNTNLGRTQVQVAQGDSLRSLAQRVYGNENLWYVLADANGLDEGSPLVAGSTLTAPEVKTSSNDAKTFKPYDPSEITGPTTPSMPYVPPPDKGCGVIGQIIMLVVVIAVTYFTAGALTGLAASTLGPLGSAMLVGGIAGAAGSAAGQVAGNMTGVVDGFSFKDIAMGAVTGAIGGAFTQGFGAGAKAAAGSGKVVSGATKFATYSTKAGAQLTALGKATVGLATYAGGVVSNKLMGRDTDFSWKGVAASVAGSFAGSAIGSRMGGRLGVFGASLAESAVTASARRTFGMEKQDWSSIVAQAIASTLGSMLPRPDSFKAGGYSDNTKEGSAPAKQLSTLDPNAIFGPGGIYATAGQYGDPRSALELGEMPEWAQAQTITVGEGDTLSGLAAKHLGDAEQWAAIAYASGVKGESIRAGQQLTIPAVGTYDPAAMALASGEFYQQKAAMQLAIAAAGPGSGGGGGTGSMPSTAWPQILSSDDDAFIRSLTELDIGIPLGGSCPIRTYPTMSAYDPSLAARRAQSADAIAMTALNPFGAITGVIASGAGQDARERAILGAGAVTQPLLDFAGGRAISPRAVTRVVTTPTDFAKLKFRYVEGSVAGNAVPVAAQELTPVRFGDNGAVYAKLPAPSNPAVMRWQRTNGVGVSNRVAYMGATPGKETAVGLEVQARMRVAGALIGEGAGRRVLGRDGDWYPIASTDMGHIDAAVDYWNAQGRYYGPRSPEVRSFMNDPKNYWLEPSSLNRSAGASMARTYLPPATQVERVQFFSIPDIE